MNLTVIYNVQQIERNPHFAENDVPVADSIVEILGDILHGKQENYI